MKIQRIYKEKIVIAWFPIKFYDKNGAYYLWLEKVRRVPIMVYGDFVRYSYELIKNK